MNWYTDIGLRIKAAREKMKLSQTELAEKINVTREAISKYENGNRKIPEDTLQKIAEELNTDFVYLITGYNHENLNFSDFGLTNESLSVLRILQKNKTVYSDNILAAINILLKNPDFLALVGQYIRSDFAQDFIIDVDDQPRITAKGYQIKTAQYPHIPINLEKSTRLSLLDYLRIIRETETGDNSEID